MDKNDERELHQSRSRFDFAAKLFRPHRSFFGGAKGTEAKPATTLESGSPGEDRESRRYPLDVICCGMYRACSTWQYEVVAHLIEHYLGGERLGYLTGDQFVALARADTSSSPNSSKPTTRSRVMKSHDRDRSFARAIAVRQAVAIYAYRDIREVVFSLMHKRGMTFEQLLRQGMIHQILANDRFWMAQPDVFVQRYEELLTDPARGVAELARYLAVRLDESDINRIAHEYSHESNKARTDALRRRLEAAGVNLDNSANLQICDATTLLHWNHIRQADSRSWHALATARQRALLERLCGPWLAARGYGSDSPNPDRSALSLRERMGIEFDLIVGIANFWIRFGSQRFPRVARTVKGLLGVPTATQAGATAWSDATSTQSGPSKTDEATSLVQGQPRRK